jgi:hypothetical protein
VQAVLEDREGKGSGAQPVAAVVEG